MAATLMVHSGVFFSFLITSRYLLALLTNQPIKSHNTGPSHTSSCYNVLTYIYFLSRGAKREPSPLQEGLEILLCPLLVLELIGSRDI